MLYSKRCYLRPSCIHLPLLLATMLLLSQPSVAEPDLIGSDMGISSSSAGNNLFDADTPDTQSPPLPKLTPAEAAELVRRRVGGQVMSVSTQQNDSGVVYGVKVLKTGRMRVIHVDGQSGQLINQQPAN